VKDICIFQLDFDWGNGKNNSRKDAKRAKDSMGKFEARNPKQI